MKELLLIYAAYTVAAASPGPSNMAIMGAAMTQGRKLALALAAGVITISVCWGLIAVTGISAILMSSAQVLVVLKAVGGLYLLWLALKAARSAAGTAPVYNVVTAVLPGLGDFYRRGVLLHLGNPKAVLAWMAIMSLGLKRDAPQQMVVTAFGGCALLGALTFAGYAVLFSTAPMVRGYERARRWIEGALALFFGGAGARLLFPQCLL